uniref:GRF-type domain-containing protein n=1 Tax=Leersia perrieri TaxID=77586 RepID=A0A0D9UZR0_9ORYZ
MFDHERAVEMQVNKEAPPGCLKSISQYNPQEQRSNGFPENSEKKNDIIAREIVLEASPLPNQGFIRPFQRPEYYAYPFIYADYQVPRQLQPYSFDNRFYQINRDHSFPIENRVQYVSFKMPPQGYPPDAQFQEFQYFVVIDFEATCDKENNLHPQEIIEFPSVLVNSATGQLEASFQTYVRPAHHQLLTDFCKELTGIQQIQVDRGVPLSEALLMHDKWLEEKGIKHKNFAIVTWSNWDCRVMLESECMLKKIRKPPYFNRWNGMQNALLVTQLGPPISDRALSAFRKGGKKWINLKVPFQEVFGGVRCNLKEAVEFAGLTWEGRAHCGLDDARNTARLLALLMHRGFKFSITNSLVWQSAPQSITCQSSPARSPDPNQSQHKPMEVLGSPVQVNPYAGAAVKKLMYCYCGVLSQIKVTYRPGPNHGRYFYGCGNYTATRKASCGYWVWMS